MDWEPQEPEAALGAPLPLPAADPSTGLGAFGFTPAQIATLTTLHDMFSVEPLEGALASQGWTIQEHIQELVAIARSAPKPSDRRAAMNDLRVLILDTLKLNQKQVTATRKIEYTDERGNTITDSVTFSDRYLGPTGRRPSDIFGGASPGPGEGSDGDDSFEH